MRKIYKSTRILFPIIFLFASIVVSAQTVTLYTPNGSTVEAFMNYEMSSQEITYYTNLYRNTYPQAEVLANASSTYNCHSYAWNLSEGGSTICWLNQTPDLHKYWDDYSYFETTESNAEKIFYYSGDHSAIKSKTVIGKYESKWGPMPLMRHAPGYGPSIYNMTYRRYYIKFSDFCTITGPSAICTSGIYTLNNLPTGATVTWSANEVVSLQPNGNSVTVTKVGAGYFTLIASIYINGSYCCNVYSEYIYVPMAHPIVMESVNRLQALDADATLFRILNPIPAEAWRYRGQLTVRSITENNYTWSKISPATNDVQWTANGATVDVYTRFAEKELTLQCRGVDPCGNVNISYFTFTTKANPIIPVLMVYPNPATDIVTVELKTDENGSETTEFSRVSPTEVKPYSIQLWNEHQGLVRTMESTSAIQQLSLSGLSAGMYFIVLVKDGEAINRQILWVK